MTFGVVSWGREKGWSDVRGVRSFIVGLLFRRSESNVWFVLEGKGLDTVREVTYFLLRTYYCCRMSRV